MNTFSNAQVTRSEDADAVQQIQAKIAAADKLQTTMRAANVIIRSVKLSDEEKVARARLHAELREHILATCERVAQTANSGLILLYWQVGDRIRRHVLNEKRAAYSQEIVSALATQLDGEFGGGFSRRNLFNMMRFSELCLDYGIVQALTAQLGWAHFVHIIRFDDPLKRHFYA